MRKANPTQASYQDRKVAAKSSHEPVVEPMKDEELEALHRSAMESSLLAPLIGFYGDFAQPLEVWVKTLTPSTQAALSVNDLSQLCFLVSQRHTQLKEKDTGDDVLP